MPAYFVPLLTSLSESKCDNRTLLIPRRSVDLSGYLLTIIMLNKEKGIFSTGFCDVHQLITLNKNMQA
ncbi:hypothetical protein DW203_13015 [Citrobacter portucalensis]|nr:hypothetical protein AM348_09900 [Citrobacter freundii]AUV42334.1 hypothetical protein C2U43_05380 [Citrobacter freundii complex sp. CFNIH9]KAA1142048.1 hypothetical protein D3H39_20205 [Citrobacter portucalensis]NCB86812.1 hypothetical protein [Gammaproteobacteria bacterium]OPW95313.1 hypothetical protein BZK41_14510 [Citrobacter sp. A316]RNL74906.1 hypothetical protein D7I40_11425 [Citrobacter sp. MH181794]